MGRPYQSCSRRHRIWKRTAVLPACGPWCFDLASGAGVRLNRVALRDVVQVASNPVTTLFSTASTTGFNIVRIFGYGVESYSSFVLQTSPGAQKLDMLRSGLFWNNIFLYCVRNLLHVFDVPRAVYLALHIPF